MAAVTHLNPLPIVPSRPGTSSNRNRRNSLGERRRVSLSVLPSPHANECTILPALASVQALLHEEPTTVQEFESQIQQTSSQLESSDLSPLSPSIRAAADAREAVGVEKGRAWRVLVLGRTFKDFSETFVIDCVVEVLEMDRKEAEATVARAKDKLMHVIYECPDRKAAFEIMEALRSRGLVVEVTSELSLPGRERRSKAGHLKPGARRHSFSSSTGFSASMALTADDVQPPPGPSPPGLSSTSRRRLSGSVDESVLVNVEGLSPTSRRRLSGVISPVDLAQGERSPKKSLLSRAMEFTVQQTPADAVEALFEKEERDKKAEAQEEEKRTNQAAGEEEEDSDDGDEEPPQEKLPQMTQIPRLKALIGKHRSKILNKKLPLTEGLSQEVVATATAGRRASWDNVFDLLDVNSTEASSVSPQRKEACDMMRFLCFGINWILGKRNDGIRLTAQQAELYYLESIGAREEVKSVLSIFHMLDSDRSGRVDQAEMQTACLQLMKQRFLELARHLEQERIAQLEGTFERQTSHGSSSTPRRPSLGQPTKSGRRHSACGTTGETNALQEVRTEALQPQPPQSPRRAGPGRPGRSSNAETQAEQPGSPKARMKRRASESIKHDVIAPQPVSQEMCRIPTWAQPLQNEDSLNPERSATRVLEKLSQYLLGKKSSFTLEDMFRTIWMKATRFEVDKMKSWCDQFIDEARNARVQPPPVLPQAELDGLKSVFHHYDVEGSGQLSFEQLVKLGLIYEDQIDKCKEEWDSDRNDVLDVSEFCQMMCPAGYRASREAHIGTMKDGTRVKFDSALNVWRLENPDTQVSISSLKSE